MAKATLVIMAAGIGSRFGGGIKQLEPVGPNGEIIMDYSIYDAMEAGFDKVVFVIRKDLEADFREVIGSRIEQVVEVAYAFQEKDDIPEQFRTAYVDRMKPWGTGQAILCCKDVVNEPFLVINADDYYGKEAYVEAYEHLTRVGTVTSVGANANCGFEKCETLTETCKSYAETMKEQICMVGFVLGNTLSENGGVTRGICKVDENQMLTDIVETKNIMKTADGAVIRSEDGDMVVDVKSPVSMNMWGLQPSFFAILENGFAEFLAAYAEDYQRVEYLLPTIVGSLLAEGKADVKVLKSHDQWFGVTYKEDKPYVVGEIRKLIESGIYPEKLFYEKI